MNNNDRLDNLIRNGNVNVGLNTMNGVECVNTGKGFELRVKEFLKEDKHSLPELSAQEEIKTSDTDENYKRSDYENLVYGIKMYYDTDNSRLDIAGGSIYLELRRLIYKCGKANIPTFPKSNFQYQYNQASSLYNPINSLMLDSGMNIANQCIFSMIDRNILSHKNFDTEYICYSDILRNTIETLFDMYHICDDENSKRVFKFIDYFIKTFKPEK